MKKNFILLLLVLINAGMSAQKIAPANMARANDPNQVVGETIKTTGIVSLSVGMPCLAAGISCLMYANFLPNPMDAYTTNANKAKNDPMVQYIPLADYEEKARAFTASTHAAEIAGYILTPLGGALTVVGIPLYIQGNKCTMYVNCTGNGANVTLNF